jgi:hypothetical protein
MTALFPSTAGKEWWVKAKVAHNGNCIIGNAVPSSLSGAAQLTGTVYYKCRNTGMSPAQRRTGPAL